jgi:hypothetical protein
VRCSTAPISLPRTPEGPRTSPSKTQWGRWQGRWEAGVGESEGSSSHTNQNSPSSFLCVSWCWMSGSTSSHSLALQREGS